jgi:hypothetical protein
MFVVFLYQHRLCNWSLESSVQTVTRHSIIIDIISAAVQLPVVNFSFWDIILKKQYYTQFLHMAE